MLRETEYIMFGPGVSTIPNAVTAYRAQRPSKSSRANHGRYVEAAIATSAELACMSRLRAKVLV
jgi:hypothetical protein